MAGEKYDLDFQLRATNMATGALQSFGKDLGGLANVAKVVGVGVAVALAGTVTAAINMAESFDTPMRKILSLTGISADQFQDYKNKVLDLSTIVPKSAVDLANGLYFVVSAGFQGADAMKILEYSAKAASSGLTDTKTVADAVTSALNAYKLTGKDAASVTDLITEAVLQGKTEYGNYAGSIGRVLPIAAALHVNLQEVNASMATMTRIGLNADEAATALRGTLNSLAKPTTAAATALHEMGLSGEILRQQLKDKGLLFVLQELMDKTGGNVETLGHIIPNIRALTGVLATAGSQGEQYAAILKSMGDSAGLTDEAFKKTADGLSASGEIALNSLKAIGIQVGEFFLPKLVEGAKGLAGFVNGLRDSAQHADELRTAIEKNNPKLVELETKTHDVTNNMGAFWKGFTTKIADPSTWDQAKANIDSLLPPIDEFKTHGQSAREMVQGWSVDIEEHRSKVENNERAMKAWQERGEKVASAFGWLWHKVLEPFAVFLADTIIDTVTRVVKAIEDLAGQVEKVIKTITDAWNKVSGLFGKGQTLQLNAEGVPVSSEGMVAAGYAEGGFVPRDMLAMVHAGEYVMTPSEVRSGRGGSGPIHIHVDLDGHEIAQAVFDPISEMTVEGARLAGRVLGG